MDEKIWREQDILGHPQLLEVNARILACAKNHVGLYIGMCPCPQASSLGILIMADVSTVTCAICGNAVELIQLPHYIPVQGGGEEWYVIVKRYKKQFPKDTTNIFQVMED